MCRVASKSTIFATAILVAGVSHNAAAESQDHVGLYARVGVGGIAAGDLDQSITHDPRVASIVTPPNEQTTSFSAGPSASFALGFMYEAGTRTELEYRYADLSVDEVLRFGGFDPVEGELGPTPIAPGDDASAHFLISNIYYDVAEIGGVTAYIAAGVGGGFFKDAFGARDAALAYQGKAGLSTRLADKFYVDVEYIYTRTGELAFGSDALKNPEDLPSGEPGTLPPLFDGDEFQSSSVFVALRAPF